MVQTFQIILVEPDSTRLGWGVVTFSAPLQVMLLIRIPTVKLKIPGKAFLKSESRTSVTFKLKFLTLAIYRWQRLALFIFFKIFSW